MSDPLIARPATAQLTTGQTEDQSPPTAEEAAPCEVLNRTGRAPLLLLCDHATRFVPPALGTLGLSEAELSRHIAWDIGIAEVTRGLAERLDAPAVLSRFSRLVIDPNRALDDPTLVPRISGGVVIPGNQNLAPVDLRARIDRFHRPYHETIERVLEGLCARVSGPAVVSMHSFTPVIEGMERPWHIGVLWNEDRRLSIPLMAHLRAQGISVGDNEPYSAQDGHGHTLFVHAAPRRLANVLIEIRQDLIDTHHGAAEWTHRLGDAVRVVLENSGVLDAAPRR